MAKPLRIDTTSANSWKESLYIQIIRMLPRNALSQAVGNLSDTHIPEALRPFVYGTFASIVGANVEECELPLDTYESVNEFFTRKLRRGVHTIQQGPGLITSPVDARVSQFGKICDGKLVQTKGREYSVHELLGGGEDSAPFEKGSFITLYLSPKDYHRVHSPVPGSILGYRYKPGHLFPVNAASVNQVDELFCINERIIVFLDAFTPPHVCPETNDYQGVPVASVLVGATCVGRMRLAFDDCVTNVPSSKDTRVHYQDSKEIKRAEELGMFQLGSTVVLVFGDEDITWSEDLHEGMNIRLGDEIGRF